MVESQIRRRNACIVLLGDIGRSPRMEYHALSLLEQNFNVDLICYVETKPLEALSTAQPRCKIHELAQVPVINLTPKLKYLFKTFWQTLSLLMALISIRRSNFLLVQNPPAIPTLVICVMYCALTRTKLAIDWHNYTYSILSLSTPGGEKSVICRLAKWIESYFGRKADAHFCVTKAMKEDLMQNWSIGPATVLYDRPASQFRPINLKKKHELFMKLSKDYPQFMPKCYSDLKESGVLESTAFTQKLSNGTVLYKNERSGILVSSTSWTPDEDFSILLKALEEYEITSSQQSGLYPNIICVITGKGPLKEQYEREISNRKWSRIAIITPWLEIEDYPTLLAAADLGVCLHWSSSGLDLPMKVVDMFGCGLPVCAHSFNCLNELVIHDQNGFIFNNYQELADQLKSWFKLFPNNPTLIESKEKFRKNLQEFQDLRWRENWNAIALPVFNKLI